MIEIIVYEPNQRTKIGIFKTLVVMFKNVYRSRELIMQLYKRDLLMQFKKSFFGMGWLFFAPIMSIISWVLINAAGVLSPGNVGVPYPVYVLLSTSLWGLFMNFYTNSGQTLQVAQGFISQVNFHHEALMVKQGLQDLTNFGITIMMNLLLMLLFHVTPHWQIIFLPILILPIFLIGGSFGIVISIANTITTDIQRIAAFTLSLLMFITPVIYSASVNKSLLQKIIYYNPLTYLICGPRDLILYGHINNSQNYWYALALTIALFLFTMRFFYVSEKRVIEKMI
jgi:lipopolysaccharide transport system permease protein